MALDQATFAAECARHRPALVAYLVTCSGDPHLAEDLAQEALLIATEQRERYFEDADFNAWLIAIARHRWFKARDRLRRQERVSDLIHEQAAELFDPAAYAGPELERELAALRTCVARLNATDRALLDQHFTEGWTYARIAERAERGLSWVKVRMHRLRKGLADCVQRRLRGA